jgi:FMN phosphatase YigB (HAD superfamily)
MGHRIRCILFDLGSTLWIRKDKSTLLKREHTANQNAVTILRHFTSDKGLPPMDSLTLGNLLRRTVEERIRSEVHQNPGYEPDFALASMEALRKLGISKANYTLGGDIYEALRIRIPDSRLLFDDTLFTLTALKQRGYILGVVTNRHYGGKPFHEDLRIMGMLDYFEYHHMAISADLGIRKPHPDIFMYALSRLNVLPEEAAMVGDSLKADIAGAKMLNMLAIWKPKASLREKAKVASWERRTHSAVALSRETLSPDIFDGEENVAVTDDNLLTYVQNRDNMKLHHLQDDIKPDVIIENLSNLLRIF